MTLLLASEFAPNRFRRVLIARFRKDGTGPLAVKWSGTIESAIVRQAGKYLAVERAAEQVDYEVGARKYRVTRVD